MAGKSKAAGLVWITATLLVIGALAWLPSQAVAAKEAVPIEGVGYRVDISMADNLKAFAGRRVYLTLDTGTVMVGIVKAVGDHLVHLEKLDGKEYFDALIRIDAIRAMDARFRQ